MPAIGCNVQRPETLRGLELQIGASVNKQTRALRVSLPARDVQRGALLHIDLIERVQLWRCKQEHHTAAVSAEAGHVERCAASGNIAQIWISAAIEKQLYTCCPPSFAREEHRRVSLCICHVWIMARLEELAHALKVSTCQGYTH
jgi:hypothetical protein